MRIPARAKRTAQRHAGVGQFGLDGSRKKFDVRHGVADVVERGIVKELPELRELILPGEVTGAVAGQNSIEETKVRGNSSRRESGPHPLPDRWVRPRSRCSCRYASNAWL